MLIDDILDYCIKSKDFHPEIHSRLKNAVMLKAQNVANYLMQENDKEVFDIQKDFPVVSPPWETYVVYWSMPEWTKSSEVGVVDRGIRGLNIELFTLVHSFKEKDGWVLALSIFLKCKNVVEFFGVEVLPINKEGGCSITSNQKIPIGVDPELVKKFGENTVNDIHTEARNVVLMANCFCNCKNVEKAQNNLDERLIKRRQRDGKIPVKKFYTLNISPMFSGTQSSIGNINGSEKSFHICRGHFKHFTNEKPLLGKHTGAYWWGMQVKGSKDVGIINKDYNIKGDAKNGK